VVTAKRFDLIYLDQSSFIIVILLSDNTVKNKLIKLPFSFDESLIKRLAAVFNASFTGIAESAITPLLIESTERGAGDTLGLTSVIAGFLSETLRGAFVSQGVVSGGESLLKIPEFQDSDKAHRVMSYLSGDGVNMLGSIDDTSDVRVVIGAENAAEELRDTSVILASYDAGDGMRGVIGVVGPTRMDYGLVAAKLRFIADGLSKVLSGGSLPPAGFGKLMLREGDKDVKG
jgi:heat-inducible transcriptional repressor